MGNKKETPDVNASSTADIAFLLLVFFLISSTMTSDFGLGRMLPPIAPPDQTDAPMIWLWPWKHAVITADRAVQR